MSKKIVMYQKSTCSTCKKEKAYLTKVKVSFDEIDIVKTPPTREFLEAHIEENNLDAYLNKHSRNPDENPAERKITQSDTEKSFEFHGEKTYSLCLLGGTPCTIFLRRQFSGGTLDLIEN